MKDFQGKLAVVTGAASGIGSALARALAQKGARVVLCDNNAKGLDTTLAEIESAGGKATAHALDISKRDDVHALADEIARTQGGADIVINCAGVAQIARVEELTYDDLEWVMDINYWGMVYGTKAFLPQLIEKGAGAVVNVSSIFGVIGVPTQAAYNSSKFAIRGFTEALAHELRETDITVSCVHPGGINTNIMRNARLSQRENMEADKAEMIESFAEIARKTPEYAAQVILKGVRKGRRRILIGGDARYMDWIQRLFPGAYERVLIRRSVGSSLFGAGREQEAE